MLDVGAAPLRPPTIPEEVSEGGWGDALGRREDARGAGLDADATQGDDEWSQIVDPTAEPRIEVEEREAVAAAAAAAAAAQAEAAMAAKVAAEVTAAAQAEAGFQSTLHRLEAESQAIALLEVSAQLEAFGAEVQRALPTYCAPEAEPPLCEVLCGPLAELHSHLGSLTSEMERSEGESLAAEAELQRLKQAHAAAGASLLDEQTAKARLEADAAEVAESLLIADEQISSLSTELEQVQARASVLSSDVQTAQRSATEQAAAVQAHVAAVDELKGRRRAEQALAHAAVTDLADGLTALCDRLLSHPRRTRSLPPSAILAGGRFGGAPVAGAKGGSSAGWVMAAQRAWVALEQLEGSQLSSADERYDAPLLAAEVHRAEADCDAYQAALRCADESLEAMVEEMRHQQARMLEAQQGAMEQLRAARAEAAIAQRVLALTLVESEDESARGAAAAANVRRQLAAELELNERLASDCDAHVGRHAQLQASQVDARQELEAAHEREQRLQAALHDLQAESAQGVRAAAEVAAEGNVRVRVMQRETATLEAAQVEARQALRAEGAAAAQANAAMQRTIDEEATRFTSLRLEHAAVSAQAEERASQLDAERAAATQREHVLRVQLRLAVGGLRESDALVGACEGAMRRVEEQLAEANDGLSEIAALEDQLSASELRSAAMQLHGCVRTAWLTSLGEALRRWSFFVAKEGDGVAWPLRTDRTRAGRQQPSELQAQQALQAEQQQQQQDQQSEAQMGATSRALLPPPRDGSGAAAPGLADASPNTSPLAKQAQRELSTTRGGGGGGGGGGTLAATGAARRTARLLELTRVVWLSPLGGGACARALWRWQHAASIETRRQLLDESRRLRVERDGATDRERQLKRGISGLREERASLSERLATAQAELQRASEAPTEETHLRRALHSAHAERDGLAKALREAREAVRAGEGDVEAAAERERAEKRAAAQAHRERQNVLRELSEVKVERKEAAAREAAALERARNHRLALEKMRAERDAALQRVDSAERAARVSERASAEATARGELITNDDAALQARQLAGAARLDLLLRGWLKFHLAGRALRRWALVALGRPAGITDEEAASLMGTYRESRRLVKQLNTYKDELKEQVHMLSGGTPARSARTLSRYRLCVSRGWPATLRTRVPRLFVVFVATRSLRRSWPCHPPARSRMHTSRSLRA